MAKEKRRPGVALESTIYAFGLPYPKNVALGWKLALALGEADHQVQAAAPQRVRQLARVVGGEHHLRQRGRAQRADLGDGDGEVGEHLEEQRLHLRVGLVDLVDEQQHRPRRTDGMQERPRHQEALREEQRVGLGELVDGGVEAGGADQLDQVVFQELRVEELLAVLPVIERAALVDALVALQADQLAALRRCERARQLGLAHAGRPLDEQRPLEPGGEERGGADAAVGQVPDLLQSALDVFQVGPRHGRVGHRCFPVDRQRGTSTDGQAGRA